MTKLRVASATQVEKHGVEIIPDPHRDATVFDFARICWGSANSLSTAVLGAFPIMFGLSFYQAVAATLLGVFVGSFLLAPMAIFGPITGTNNPVSSSAHFGVVGRIVGSVLGVLAAVAFFAISVWASGDAVMGAVQRAFQIRPSSPWLAFTYAVFAVSVLIICIYGFRLMLLSNKVSVVTNSLLFIVGIAAFWDAFRSDYAGVGWRWGESAFWPPFISAALVVLGNMIAFGAFLGDWTRYLPRDTNKRVLMFATVISQWLTLLPFLFGVMTASIIARQAPGFLRDADYTGGLLNVSPTWFLAPLLILAVLSGMATGSASLYGTGLDFSSVIPRLTRPRATLYIGSLACVLVFGGRFYLSLFGALSTSISLIIVLTTPWMVVMLLGYVTRRGYYIPAALQVFNRRQIGGPYWYVRGWNLPGVAAWFISSAFALATVNIPDHFVGWLGNLAEGIDVSLVVALVLPAVLYPLFLHLYPDPKAVFGPAGPRFVPAADRPIAPIVDAR
jgi:purine-cytosine permease-like protein